MSLYILEGLKPWVVQRVSAVYLTLFLFYSLYCGSSADEISYLQWRGWLSHPFNSIASGIFVVAVLFHAWIGMRDVILDYVHAIMLRLFLLALVLGVLVGSGLWVMRLLLFSMVG